MAFRSFLLSCAGFASLGAAWAGPIPADEAAACVNLGNALDAPAEGEWGYTIEAEHLTAIAAAGFDLVRLPVRWSAYAAEDAPYEIDPDTLERVRTIIGQATEAGLGVVLDMHHYREAMADPAAHADRIVGIWANLGAAFADLPDSVAFEVLNEPNDRFGPDWVARVNAEALAAIREENPERQVVLGNADWNALSSLEGFALPRDPNVAATFHFYEPFAFTHQGAPWVDEPPPVGRRLDPERDGALLAEAEADMASAKARLGVPLFLGEFGAYRPQTDPVDRLAYMQVVREIAERQGITWCVWNFASDFAVYDVEADALFGGVRTALGLKSEAE